MHSVFTSQQKWIIAWIARTAFCWRQRSLTLHDAALLTVSDINFFARLKGISHVLKMAPLNKPYNCWSFNNSLLAEGRYKPAGRGFDSRWCQDFSPWHNPAGRTMALGSTQPLTEMSTRCVSCHQECFLGKGGRCIGLTTYHHTVLLSRNLGALTS